MNEPEKSTICEDVDTNFYAWIKSIEDATERWSKLQNDFETMDDILLLFVA